MQNIIEPLELLNTLKSYDVSELLTTNKVVDFLISQKNRGLVDPVIHDDFQPPQIHVPSELLLTYTEFLFQSFIEELFSQYPKDYKTRTLNQLTNNNEILVRGPYAIHEELGQLPTVTVEVESAQIFPMYIGNTSAEAQIITNDLIQNSKEANLQMNMKFNVVAGQRDEAVNLASIAGMSLVQASAVLRSYFGFREISFPSIYVGGPIKESPQQWLSVVQFYVRKSIRWSELYKPVKFRNVIYRLIGKSSENDANGIVQMLLNSSYSVDPEFRARLLNSLNLNK